RFSLVQRSSRRGSAWGRLAFMEKAVLGRLMVCFRSIVGVNTMVAGSGAGVRGRPVLLYACISKCGRCTIYHPRGRAFMRKMSRREALQKGLSLASLLGLSDWLLPLLAQGQTDVPFSDYPANFNAGGSGSPRRTFDIRTIDGFTVPKDKFFVLQHFNQP